MPQMASYSDKGGRAVNEDCVRLARKGGAVCLLLDGDRAVWAHVGDSRLYGFLNGSLILQTLDHSVAQMGVVLREITPDQIRFHEDRNRVLRALGQEGSLKVETGKRHLEPGQWAFLLCSDGFWEYVLEKEMEGALAQAAGPEEWLSRMRGLMPGRVPPDNDNNSAAAVWVTIQDRNV